jgi:hypothetical protein
MMKKLLPLLLVFISHFIFSQNYTQNVKGKVSDKATGIGLPGVVVKMKNDTSKLINATTDENGFYKLKNVPVGRRSFVFSLIGYQNVPVSDIIVTSGKETITDVEMEESLVEIAEVEVSAEGNKDVIADMQAVNMKQFSIEETERYPGSRNDPARMAQNFAGIQGTNDSRNDIVVRGNSPAGLLWRLEEIDIPNPNHFAVAGSAGGPTSIINNKYLANSEFFTGAFPANYSNALGGVFDLKMRNGNNEKHERTFQLGILGTELALEGPINKKTGSSYMINYRYSTLALFGALHVPISFGTSAIPKYQDGGFRFNFPTKKAGVFSFSGIGGLSNISIILSTVKERPKELYGDQTRDQYFTTDMGVAMVNNVYSFNPRTLMKTTVAFSSQYINAYHNLILRADNYVPNDTLPNVLDYHQTENKTTLSWYIKRKVNAANSFKTGFFVNENHVTYSDKAKINSLYDTLAAQIQNKPYKVRLNTTADFYLIQPYFAFSHRFNEKWSTNLGLNAQFLTLNNHWTIEPRANLRYQFKPNQTLSLAYGMHSQMQPTYVYFAVTDSVVRDGKVYGNTARIQDNKNLDFSKAHHAVLGYDLQVSRYFRIKAEVYYQYLWNIPVYAIPSGVSLINRGATFTRFFPVYTMENTGKGENKGVELTLEKLFNRHYFFMYSASLYDSKYTASNGKTYDTDFNGQYMMNLLAGLEYGLGKSKKNSINLSTKFTYGGGKRYSPANVAASNAIMDVVPDESKINSLQFAPYNRLDFRIAYKINSKRTSTEIAFDLINVLGTKNVLGLSYSPDPANINADPLIKNYQLGFLPLFYVKVDF